MGGVTQSWALVQLVQHHLSPPRAVCLLLSERILAGSASPLSIWCCTPAAWGLQGWSWPGRAASKQQTLYSSELGIQTA